MSNRLADEAKYFGALADADESFNEERAFFRGEISLLRDTVQHLMDEVKLTSSQYELCRQAMTGTDPEPSAPNLRNQLIEAESKLLKEQAETARLRRAVAALEGRVAEIAAGQVAAGLEENGSQ